MYLRKRSFLVYLVSILVLLESSIWNVWRCILCRFSSAYEISTSACDIILLSSTVCRGHHILSSYLMLVSFVYIQVGEAALSILHSMVSAHSDLDDAGEIVTPTPRVKRILSSPRCLPHIAQVIPGVVLTYDFCIIHSCCLFKNLISIHVCVWGRVDFGGALFSFFLSYIFFSNKDWFINVDC